MNKDEILEKSRKEHHGMDMLEMQSLEIAGKYATRVGLLLCCFVAVTEVAITEHVSISSWLIYFGMLSMLFFTKYHVMKKRHELMIALLYIALFFFFFVMFLRDLLW